MSTSVSSVCPQGLKSQSRIKMNIVRCPPVTMVLIRRPDLRYQLGFSVQNGIVSNRDSSLTHAEEAAERCCCQLLSY